MNAFTAPGLFPFTVAGLVLVGLVAIELLALVVGLSLSSLLGDGVDLDDVGGHGPLDAWMSWLNIGRVPLLILLMIWLATFALAGFILQSIVSTFHAPLPAVLAVPAAFILGLPVTRTLSRGVARILPSDESAAISQAEFIGMTGIVVLGPLDQGMPGQVRVRDRHGNIHVLRARAAAGHVIAQGAAVLIVDGTDGAFETIPAPDEAGARLASH